MLVGDKLKTEMHLTLPIFANSTNLKNKKIAAIMKFKETGDLRYKYQTELGKTFFH